MSELSNVFGKKGTLALIVDGKLIYIPVNEDWRGVAKVTAYDASKAKLTLKKVWDMAGTPETFYAQAKYFGQSGTPESSEVDIDSIVDFYRTGCGNVNFSSIPTAFQLHDSEATNKASFTVFFFK